MNQRFLPENAIVNLVLADHDFNWMTETAQAITGAVSQVKVVGFAQNGADAIARAVSLAADAVLVEYSLPDLTALEVARKLSQDSPGTAVFAVAGTLSAQLIMNAKAVGIREVFDKTGFVAREAAETIAREVGSLRQQWADVAAKHGLVEKGTGPRGLAVGNPPAKQVIAQPITQTVILVHSPKGGVGKSTVSVNLAVALKQSPVLSGLRVALLDFDCLFGNLAVLCGLPPNAAANRNTIAWEHASENLTAAEVDDMLVPMQCGVMVLPAPPHPNAAERVTMQLADKILRTLRRYYSIIVIDGGPKVSEPVNAALHHATHVLLIATPEGQATENLARMVQWISPDPDRPEKPDLTHILRKMSLVLNRTQNRRSDLAPGQVARLVGRPIIAELPEDESVPAALHDSRGKQTVELYPNAPFSLAIKRLANDLCAAYPLRTGTNQQPRTSWFKKLLRRAR